MSPQQARVKSIVDICLSAGAEVTETLEQEIREVLWESELAERIYWNKRLRDLLNVPVKLTRDGYYNDPA